LGSSAVLAPDAAHGTIRTAHNTLDKVCSLRRAEFTSTANQQFKSTANQVNTKPSQQQTKQFNALLDTTL
jgi:hypothetical protein